MTPAHLSAYRESRWCVLETSGDVLDIPAPGLPPYADRQQYEACLQWSDAFFEKPVCRHCFQPTSRRNARPLSITNADEDRDGMSVSLGKLSPPLAALFSARFVDALTQSERDGIEFQTVETSPPGLTYFELVGPRDTMVAAHSMLAPAGWRCPACHHAVWSYRHEDAEISLCLSQADIPLRSMFVVGDGTGLRLVVSNERWSELGTRQVARGLHARELALLPPSEATYAPALPEREPPRYFDFVVGTAG